MKNPTDTVRKAEGEKLESITVHPVQQTEVKKFAIWKILFLGDRENQTQKYEKRLK
jgi:hypothetical protein